MLCFEQTTTASMPASSRRSSRRALSNGGAVLLLLWLLFSDGGFKLSDNRLGELVRVELAGLGKLDDSDCDELRNGDGLDARQPQSGAQLFEGFVHRVDLVRAKKRRAVASAVDCIAQLGSSLRASPLRLVRRWHGGATSS